MDIFQNLACKVRLNPHLFWIYFKIMYERVGLILINLFFSNLINMNTFDNTKQTKMFNNQFNIVVSLRNVYWKLTSVSPIYLISDPLSPVYGSLTVFYPHNIKLL